jgi:multidrug efflux system outer membrane protein
MMTTLRLASIALLAATVGACATMAPEYRRPEPPVPVTFPGVVPAAGSAGDLAAVSWREYFVDERLRAVIDIALASNRDLRVAALNIDKARAQYQIQRATMYPSVNAVATENAQFLGDELTAAGHSTILHEYSATIGFTAWELDFFGRIRSLNAQALEEYLATEEARRSVQISLVAEVARTWLVLAADRERLALARSTLEARQKSLELTRRSFEGGVASALDVADARTLMEGARGEAARLKAIVDQDENALVLIVGAPVPASLQPAQLVDAVTLLAEVPAGLSSEVLVRRPDILRAEHQLQAANASIGAARAAFFPRISLTAAAGTASLSLDNLFGAGSGVWSFAPQISVPIFNAGSLAASLEVTQVQREIAVAQYEKSIQSAFREVADVLAERATLAEQLDARRGLVAATSESFRLYEARYRAGLDGFLGLLVAQRSLFVAEQELIAVRYVDAANRIALYRTLGGGWQ